MSVKLFCFCIMLLVLKPRPPNMDRSVKLDSKLARDAQKLEGFHVIGGYMSPVNDAYKKRGLISAKHRIELCHRACRSSEFIMVDPWEANQITFKRTLTLLCRIKSSLVESGQISGDSLKVMLVCGSDLLESFSIPGAWIREQASREGQAVDKIICNDDILSEYKNNIKVVKEIVPNQISSTRKRHLQLVSCTAQQMQVSCDCAVSFSHVHLVLPHSCYSSDVYLLIVVNPVEQQQQQQSYTAPENTHDQDCYVPTANITRVMRRVLPPQAKIADDAKETVQQCVTEYINMITSEANDRCHREERKTITADDILWAIERLGFDNYAGPLSLFLNRFRDAQRQWSEESRERLGSRVAHSRRLPPPTYGLLPPQGDGSGISSDNAGAGSSSSTSQGGAASFNPQFKR
ncbi:hypothetical protein RHSIM_Rhsim04G0012600 [Rhododendron simsii]|uniref:Cytidyltransferase-like domain-containing protein n=1 Tax=Rhododendron simsii TaxID=118357 RepID=A0A834H3S6_RHOSS|nr:hypothetical protein RHSIM_Rhsim04G0012600 [Rhododendron simsii]